MISMFRSWWLHIKQHRLLTLVVIIALVAVAVFALLVGILGWDWTGVNGGYSQITITSINRGTTTTTVRPPGRTLWDFLPILIVPIILTIGGFWLNRIQKSRDEKAAKQRDEVERAAAEQRATTEQTAAEQRATTEREIAADNQRETALQAYIDKMSELLLEKNLRNSSPEDEVRKLARVRTLTVLPRLDGKRKRNLLLFLYDANLIDRKDQIINVSDADLSEADLSEVDLYLLKWTRSSDGKSTEGNWIEADLSGVNLRKANLSGANLKCVKLGEEARDELTFDILVTRYSNKGTKLYAAYLGKANLHKADLSNAILGWVDLRKAKLSEAILAGAHLREADLRGADLRGADLSIRTLVDSLDLLEDVNTNGWETDLRGADLQGANLCQADLSGADLRGANLSGANLYQADLSGTDLREVKLSESGPLMLLPKVNLEGANLKGAVGITPEKLKEQAGSLKGATMPDGSIHP